MTSNMKIPQGSVLSPLLCNLYTSESVEYIRSKMHTEFADDNTVVSQGQTTDKASEVAVNGLYQIINSWCP